MSVLIGIPTYKRIKKLTRCLNSIKNSNYNDYDIVVIADNQDWETKDYLKEAFPNVKCFVQSKHQFVIGAWNNIVQIVFIPRNYDYFCGLCDDVELLPGTLKEIVRYHKANFPDTDGVVGIKQDCPRYITYKATWYGQTLMGRKFIERYAKVDYKICCPDYKHFYQDEEMHKFATSIRKFTNCESTLLHHYHPCFVKEELDETHNVIRSGPISPKKHDIEMYKVRQEKGYLWGKDFNLVGSCQ